MSASLHEPRVGDASPGDLQPAEERASSERPALSLRRWLPRAQDALVLVWLTVFHHVLGVKYRFAQIAYDEHYFLMEGWSVLKGQIPYRDFQEFKPPVIFFVHALGLQLFGLEDLGYRKILALLSLAGFIALAVALLSRRVNRWLVVAALMLMINHFYDDGLHNGVINDAESLALDFFMLGVGVLLIRTRWQRTQQFLGGALLALSPLSKEPMAFAVVAAWLSLLLLHRGESAERGEKEGDSRGATGRFALFTIAGVATVAATWLVYMLVTRSFSWYLLQLKLNFAYTENYAYQLRWAVREPPGGVLAESWRRLRQGYVDAAHLAVFIPFFLGLSVLPSRQRLAAVGALVTFAASLYAVSVGGGFAARYYIMAMTGAFFCVTLGALGLDALAKRPRHDLSPWLGAAGVALALFMTMPRFGAEWKKYGSYQTPPPPVHPGDIDFVRQHTGPTDTIFTTDDPLLCVYSDRASAFRGGIVLDEIIEYYPGSTDEERLSVIREGLEEKRPKLVVVTNGQVSARRKRRYMKALVMPFLRDHGYIRLTDKFYLRPD